MHDVLCSQGCSTLYVMLTHVYCVVTCNDLVIVKSKPQNLYLLYCFTTYKKAYTESSLTLAHDPAWIISISQYSVYLSSKPSHAR